MFDENRTTRFFSIERVARDELQVVTQQWQPSSSRGIRRFKFTSGDDVETDVSSLPTENSHVGNNGFEPSDAEIHTNIIHVTPENCLAENSFAADDFISTVTRTIFRQSRGGRYDVFGSNVITTVRTRR